MSASSFQESSLSALLRAICLVPVIGLACYLLAKQPPAHQGAAHRLDIGTRLWMEGNHDSAWIAYQESLKLAISDNDLENLARVYARIGIRQAVYAEYEQAFAAFDSAISLAGTIDSLHDGIVLARIEQSNLLRRLGEADRALSLQEELIAEIQKQRPIRDSLLAHACIAAGQTQLEIGDLNGALGYLETARQTFKHLKGAPSADLSHCELLLGKVYHQLNRSNEAVEACTRSLAYMEQVTDPADPELLSLRMVLGDLFYEMGLLWESREQREAVLPHRGLLPSEEQLAEILALGSVAFELALYPEAIAQYDAAESLLRDHAELSFDRYSDVLIRKAIACAEIGREEEAVRMTAMAFSAESEPQAMASVSVESLSLVSRVLKGLSVTDAWSLWRQSAMLNQALIANNPERRAIAWSTLGEMYQRLGQSDSAGLALEEAALNYEEARNISGLIHTRIRQAVASRKMGSLLAAMRYHKMAWDLSFPDLPFQKGPDDRIRSYWRQPHVLDLLLAQGRTLDAISVQESNDSAGASPGMDCFLQGIAIADSQQLYVAPSRHHGRPHFTYRALCEAAIISGLRQDRHTSDPEQVKAAWRIAEQFREYSNAEYLRSIPNSEVTDVPDSLLQTEQRLRQWLSVGETEPHSNQSEANRAETECMNAYRKMLSLLEKEYPRYYQKRYLRSTPALAEVLDELSSWQVMISYFEGEEVVIRFVIYDDEMTTNIIRKDEAWQSSLDSWRSFISSPPDGIPSQQVMNAGHQLYDLLVPTLPEKVEEYHIIPSGSLWSLPFESLLMSLPEHQEYSLWDFMGKELVIAYHSSSSGWMEGQEKESKYAEYIGFAPGSSDLSVGGESSLPPLPGAAQMVTQTAELLKGIAFVDRQATKHAFQEIGEENAILHFAAQTIVSEPAFDGGICLAPDSSGADRLLTMSEMYGQPLTSPLVVLSHSATGAEQRDPGRSLPIAGVFRRAGARRVIESLWTPDSISNQRMMAEFFLHLVKGRNVGEALRASREEWMENASDDQHHPYYWASHVLTGSPDGMLLEVNRGLPWWELFTGSMVLLFVFMWWWSRSAPKRPDVEHLT